MDSLASFGSTGKTAPCGAAAAFFLVSSLAFALLYLAGLAMGLSAAAGYEEYHGGTGYAGARRGQA